MALPVHLNAQHHQQPPAESATGATARLHRLARRGDVAGVEAILGRHPRLLYAHDAHGKTPLMLAAYKGHLALVKSLLTGHEVRRDAASGGREVCAQCTAIHAPSPPDPTPSTSTSATSTSPSPCCCLLRKSEALLLAAWFGHPRVCVTLLDYGADPNYRNSWGVTPLMIAAEIPFPDVVLTLLRTPTTDINARALADGRSALATAVAKGNAEAAQLLLLHGADPTLRDREGREVFALLEGQQQEGACAFVLGEWERGHALRKGRLLVEGGRAVMVAAASTAVDGDGGKQEGGGGSLIPSTEAAAGGSGSKRQKRHHHQHRHHPHSIAGAVAAGAVHTLCEDTFRELMALMGRTAAGPDVLLRFPPEVGEEDCDGDGVEALVLLSDDDDE